MANDGFEWMDPTASRTRGACAAERVEPARLPGADTEGEPLGALRAQIERLSRRVLELEQERVAVRWSAPSPGPAEVPTWAARLGVGIVVGLSALASAVYAAHHAQGGAALRAGRALATLLAVPRALLYG